MGTAGWGELNTTIEALDVLSAQAELLLAGLADRVDSLTESDPSAVGSAGVIRDLTVAAARLRQSTTGVGMVAAGCVHTTRLDRVDAARTPRKWLARHGGLSFREASALFRTSKARTDYPLVGQAFLDGELTSGHLHAVSGIVPSRFSVKEADELIDQVREIQPTLIEAAKKSTVDEFEELCGRVRARLDFDGPKDRTAEPSRVTLAKLFDGRWSLNGDLNATDGALMASILGDRLAAMKPTVNPVGPAPAEDSVFQPEPELRAEALMFLLGAGAGSTRPGRVSLFVHVDLEDLAVDAPTLTDLVSRNGNAHTEAGIDINVDSLWGLLFDADVTPVFTMTGTPLSFGRTQRLAPPVLRRILAHRDRSCRFPGGDQPTNKCEIHHLKHWENDGTTDPSNCAHLSLSHHHDHHDRGWSITGDANGDLEVRRPSGEVFDAAPAYRKQLREQEDADRAHIRSRLLASRN